MTTEKYTVWVDKNGKSHTAAGYLKKETLNKKGATSARYGATMDGRVDWDKSDMGAVEL